MADRAADAVDGSAADAAGRRVRHLRTILVRGDETCFHVVEADDIAIVQELVERAGLAAHRIAEAEP